MDRPIASVLRRFPDRLEQVYLASSDAESYVDLHATILSAIITASPGFSERWVTHVKGRLARQSAWEDQRDYTILWRRDDWEVVLGGMLRELVAGDQPFGFGYSYLRVLFKVDRPTTDSAEVERRQDALLDRLVRDCASDLGCVQRLFLGISHLPAGRRRRLVEAYLATDPPLEEFENLSLEARTWGWSGSEVPLLQERRAFVASLLDLCDRPTLVPHRTSLEARLRDFDRELERARRTDFLEGR